MLRKQNALGNKNSEFIEKQWVHPTFEYEWWYANGHVDSSTGRFSFMVTFLSGQLYLTVEDHRTGLCHVQITKEHVLQYNREKRELRYGASTWSLEEMTPFGFTHRLNVQIKGLGLNLHISPTAPPIVIGKMPLGILGSVHYYAMTELTCEGNILVDNKVVQVKGEAWIDRMWGNWKLAGFNRWEWISMLLKDRRRAVFFSVFHPILTNSPLLTLFLLHEPGGEVRRLTVGLTHLKTWRSPLTGVQYPLGWKIVSKSGSRVDLLVVPRIENQELRPFIWEGACSVSGALDELSVEGEAHGEVLYGLAQDNLTLPGVILLIYELSSHILEKMISRRARLTLDSLLARVGRRFSKFYWN